MTQEIHQSVLFDESLDALNIKRDGIYIDGTFGRGGHSLAILDRLGENGRLYAFDKDPEAVRYSESVIKGDKRFAIVHGSFSQLEQQAKLWDIKQRVNGILLDLGVSSPQLDDAARGFSFLRNGPLDMRMNPSQGLSAAEWLENEKEETIAQVIKEYGEERYAKRIARAIVKARSEQSIETTAQLAEIVAEAHPAWEKHKHPATRTFQAIRIYINQELEELKKVLQQAVSVLAPIGRLVVISFHSLEDRIVKQFIQAQVQGERLPLDLPVRYEKSNASLRKIGKLIVPSDEEIERNPRARSARLRIAEKIN